MRIALIGSGATGSVAARHLAAVPEVEEIVLADRFPERAKALADRLGGRKVRTTEIRGADVEDLAKVIAGTDLAINAAHASLDLALMEACLDERAHYMDLSSLPMKQFPYDGKFRNAGLTALLGCGEDPGLSNVLARRGADHFDRVDSIRIRDGDIAHSEETPLPVLWSPETFLEEVFAEGNYFEDGAVVRVPPWSGREVYPFPEPLGPLPVYIMDHEEPTTLGRFIGKGVRYVDFKLAIEDETRELLEGLHRLGVLREDPVLVDGHPTVPLHVFLRLLPPTTDLVGKVTGHAILVVEVSGTKDGRAETVRLQAAIGHAESSRDHGATATAYFVGTGAAIFAIQFARGQIRQTGVIAPECLDPEETIRLMAGYGLPMTEEVRVDRS